MSTIKVPGLAYVCDQSPGIRRRRHGRGFSYVDATGHAVDPETRKWIESIVIPPAWTEVWICPQPNGHILATGRDAKGRKQYRYHPRWREVRDETKFHRMTEFGAVLPGLRDQIDADLQLRGLPKDKAVALVVKLLDATLIRVGNSEYATTNESFGLTTLRNDHVDVDGPVVEFDFIAKSGLPRRLTLEDKRLARLVRRCSELGGQELFAFVECGDAVDIGSADVNQYLRDRTGLEVTSKDFRTWGGTKSAATALAISRAPESPKEAERQIVAAIDVAAEVLGNTRTVARASYIHPAVFSGFADGTLQQHWQRARDAGRLDRGERTVLRLLSD
jgi:DNA topoisomerase-1